MITPLMDNLIAAGLPEVHGPAPDPGQDAADPEPENDNDIDVDNWTVKRDGFTVRPLDRPFALEIFGGSGRLTRILRDNGLDAWAVDCKTGRLEKETPAFFILDLTTERDQKFCLKLLSHPMLAYVHFAPPPAGLAAEQEKSD